jgi:hypothetical protein
MQLLQAHNKPVFLSDFSMSSSSCDVCVNMSWLLLQLAPSSAAVTEEPLSRRGRGSIRVASLLLYMIFVTSSST